MVEKGLGLVFFFFPPALWIVSYVSHKFFMFEFLSVSYSNLHIQLNVFWRHFHLYMICRLYSLTKTCSNLKYLIHKGFQWIKLIFRNDLNFGISLIHFASTRIVWVRHKYFQLVFLTRSRWKRVSFCLETVCGRWGMLEPYKAGFRFMCSQVVFGCCLKVILTVEKNVGKCAYTVCLG